MSSMPPDELDRITGYVARDLDPEQRLATARWIAADPNRLAFADFLERSQRAVQNVHAAEIDVAAMVQRVEAEAVRPSRRVVTQARKLAWRSIGWIAMACVAVGVGIGSAIGLRARAHSNANTSGRTYRTAAGQRVTISLPDGSMMTLAPATSVTLSSTAAIVIGEAYFAIAPHPSRPFVVRTRNVDVQVLGTRFDVRQYTGELASHVVVEEGKVALQTRQRGGVRQILSARMLASVTDSSMEIERGIPVSDYIAWTQGRLVFNNVPLANVIQELSRAYGADIRLADSTLAHQPLTLAASVRDMPLAEVLKQLTLVANAHYRQDGAVFVIVPGRAVLYSAPIKQFPHSERDYGR